MNNENQWERPTPLRGNRSNLIEFPVNALPPILREMAYAIARTTSTDVSMAATAILSSVSYCFSGQFRIIGKKDHSEPLVIDSLIVAEASFKKSPVMKLVSQPYQDYVQEYNEKNKASVTISACRRYTLMVLVIPIIRLCRQSVSLQKSDQRTSLRSDKTTCTSYADANYSRTHRSSPKL